MMRINELSRLLTETILRAEQLERQDAARDAALAYMAVSALEEELASLTSPGDVEGAIARRGTVTAALSAGDYVRARDLALRFANEAGAPLALVAQLEALRQEAERDLAALQGEGPQVVPVLFREVRAA
jgi:hypothetical protein